LPTQVKTTRIFENINRTRLDCPMMVHGMPDGHGERMAGAKKCQMACKPGSVPLRAMAIHLGRPLPDASCNQPGRRPGNGPAGEPAMPPLFGFAPGGVCRAASVTGRAVRSYRTVSPLPGRPKPRPGGLFSVALSLGSPPPAVSRHRDSVEPGLSSAPKDSGHPAI